MRLLRFLPKQPSPAIIQSMIEQIPTRDGGAVAIVKRGVRLHDIYEMGPNHFHALIIRGPSGIYGEPGSIEDLGVSTNLRTNLGADWQSGAMGALLSSTYGTPATATSATSLTVTGTPLVASALIGRRIYVPITSITTTPVYGNIGANTTGVITVDQWWNPNNDSTGTTPASTNAFIIPDGYGPLRFIGLTTDAGAPAAGDTTLASEITTGGMARALGLYAHTTSATSFTASKTFAATSGFTAIHKAGFFTALTTAAGGLMGFETVLNADATVANGDSLAVTWTVNI